jgi:flagellar protein FlaG
MNPINNVQGSPPPSPSQPAKETAPESGKILPPSGNKPPPAPPVQTVERAVKQIKAFLSSTQRQLDFRLDDNSGRTIISVVNPETGELIRQIPSEEILRLAASIQSGGFQLINASA